MKGSESRTRACTSAQFDGTIAVIDPETSWVARWQRTCACALALAVALSESQVSLNLAAKYVRGIYAVRVLGHVPDDVEAELDNRGFKYRPRDQTDQD